MVKALNDDIIRQLEQQRAASMALQNPNIPTVKKKGFLLDNLSTGGSIAGALGGAAAGTAILPGVGTIIGGLLGGALGGGGGQVAENAIAGDNLMKDVGSEALWGGATALPFGAIGKLAKAGTTVARGLGSDLAKQETMKLVNQAGVKTMSRGAVQKLSLDDALKTAPARAALEDLSAKTPLTQQIGGKLSDTANNLAVKQFRLTPTQLSNFKTKFGEDAGSVIRRYGFNSAEDAASKGIDPLQEQFGKLINGAGDVSTDTLRKNFDDSIAKLKNGSSSTNRAIGEQLSNEVEGILSKYGKTIPATELNTVRREFDSLVNYTNKTADPNKYGVNKRVADVLRKTLQDADTTGQLKSVGQEISKLKQLSENIARQGELGRGSLPLNLPNLLGSIVGGASGGVPGIIAGGALTQAVNSSAGRRAIMGTVENAATKLSDKAPKTIGQSLRQPVIRMGGLGALRNTGNQSSDGINMDTTATMSNATTTPTIANMPQSYSQDTQLSSPLGYSSGQIAQALMAAYADGNDKAAKQLEGMYQLASEFEKAQQPAKLNATQMQQANNANSGLGDLGTIANILQADPNVLVKDAIPGGSIARGLTGTTDYEAAKQNIVDVIARLRSGAAITEDEAQRYMGLLPRLGDNQQSALSKIQRLYSLLNSFANPQPAASTDLASALQLSN